MNSHHSAGKTALVVEDDPGIRLLITTVLQRSGFRTTAVEKGQAALDAVTREFYDVIILDLLMPGMNGFEVLQRLEGSSPDSLRRVIVLTAVNPVSFKQFKVEERVFRLLRKPFDLEELISAVSACLNQQHRVAEAAGGFLGIRVASEAVCAKAALVGVVDPSRARLDLVWSFGYPSLVLEPFNPIPLTPSTPMGISVIEKRGVWVHSLNEVEASFGTLLPILRKNGTNALAAVPIMARGIPTGSIGWSFAQPQTFGPEQQKVLLGAAEEYAEIVAGD